jgi:pyruvate formate lyase activating enzyme
MLDWEGHLATTVFLSGCNLRCPYCHNPDLLVPSEGEGSESLLEDLRQKREWLDGVVITGGEPTLSPGLFGLLDEIASLCLPVKLDTNGTQPDKLRQLIDSGLVNSVALDLKTTPERYETLGAEGDLWSSVSESLRLILGSGLPHEFRTTAYPGLVDAEGMELLAAEIAGGDCYVIQQFRPDRTFDKGAGNTRPFTPEYLRDTAERCSAFLPTKIRGA